MSMFYSQQPTNGSLNGSHSASSGGSLPADSGASNGFPGYAGTVSNALLSLGLDLSRESLVNPITTIRAATGAAPGFTPRKAWKAPDDLPPTDVAAYLARWDPQTRFYMLITEMVSGLEFSATTDGAAIHCQDSAHQRQMLLAMTRPPRKIFDAQMAKVFARATERNDRTAEILTQVQPQFAYWAAICNLHPNRNAWTIELMTAALHFSMLVCQRLKHILACPRPVEYSSLIQPIILTPAYGTFPMGHATEAYMFAGTMRALLERAGGPGAAAHADTLDAAGTGDQLDLIARRISDNRVISGVHFPIDGPGGFVLADTLCAYLIARLDNGAVTQGRLFEGKKVPGAWDDDPKQDYTGKSAFARLGARIAPPPSPILTYMFERAQAEFAYQAPPPASPAPVPARAFARARAGVAK